MEILRKFWLSFLVAGIFWVVMVRLAIGADVPYSFTTLDITVPGHPGAVVWLKDVSKSHVLAMAFWYDVQGQPVWGSLVGRLNGRMSKLTQVEVFLDCSGEAINDLKQVVGNSPGGACIRQPNGSVSVLAGVPQSGGFGISTDGKASGQYCTDNGPPNYGCTPHAFTWHPLEGYRTIDLPTPLGLKPWNTVALAPNKFGQVLIEYIVSTMENEFLEHGFCIWANSQCSQPIALSYEWEGGPAVTLTDFNDLAQTVVEHWNTGANTLQIYDDGQFYDVSGWPDGWLFSQLEKLNNDGDFVGRYAVQVGTDPFYGSPVYEYHNFVAQVSSHGLVARR